MNSNAVRRRRFLYGVGASGAAKVMSLAVQLLAFPLALHALGTERYTSFLALQSFLSWTGLCGFGLSYALPKYIAAAHVAANRSEERNLVNSALLLMGCTCVLLVLLLSALATFVSPSSLVAAAPSIPQRELQIAYFAAVFINAIHLFGTIEVALRSGYQEIHRSSLCSLISLPVTLVGLLYAAANSISIATFIAVLFVPLGVVLLIDVALLFRQRPYLLGAFDFRKTVAKIAIPSGNAFAYQVQFALMMYIPTFAMAHLSAPLETAVFGSVLQLVVLAVGSLSLVFQPFSAAVANAHSHDDIAWIRRNHARMIKLLLLISAVGLVITLGVGGILVQMWLGQAFVVKRALLACFAFCFIFMGLAQLEFFMLSAIGALRSVGVVTLILGIVGFGFSVTLCAFFGGTGMGLGLAVSLASISGWLFLNVRRHIHARVPPAVRV